MISAGIDVGSISAKAAVIKGGRLLGSRAILTGYNAGKAGAAVLLVWRAWRVRWAAGSSQARACWTAARRTWRAARTRRSSGRRTGTAWRRRAGGGCAG